MGCWTDVLNDMARSRRVDRSVRMHGMMWCGIKLDSAILSTSIAPCSRCRPASCTPGTIDYRCTSLAQKTRAFQGFTTNCRSWVLGVGPPRKEVCRKRPEWLSTPETTTPAIKKTSGYNRQSLLLPLFSNLVVGPHCIIQQDDVLADAIVRDVHERFHRSPLAAFPHQPRGSL